MAIDSPYEWVIVESFVTNDPSGRRGAVHIRPVAPGKYPTHMYVECSKSLSRDYPVGTRFRLKAKLTDREGGTKYLYSYHGWKAEVID